MDFAIAFLLLLIYFEINTAVKCLKIVMATQVALVTPEQEEQVKKNIAAAMEA